VGRGAAARRRPATLRAMEAPLVVLVEPQIPANLGFIARVLANFGVPDWAAVGGCPVEGTEAERTGSPAPAHLAALRRVSTLDEALADRSHVVGLTARSGYHRRPVPLPELPALWRGFGPDARPALLFGREDRGLEEAECARCSHLVTIPTAPTLPSMNLSHAVGVTLYALAAEGLLATTPPDPGREGEPWAPLGDKQRFAADLVELVASGETPVDPGELEPALTRILAQPIETRDLRLVWKLLRHLRWLREQDGAS
jgi:tRNA/rRNA methyltransferase